MNQNQKPHTLDVQDQWQRAVERASQNQKHELALDVNALNDAAGLHVESGLKGGWTGSCSCQPCTTTVGAC